VVHAVAGVGQAAAGARIKAWATVAIGALVDSNLEIPEGGGV